MLIRARQHESNAFRHHPQSIQRRRAFEDRIMESTRRFFLSAIALAVSGALFTASCARHVTANNIVGRWTSEPYLSQSGLTTDTICFSADGKYTLTHGQTEPKESQGTYSTTGADITFNWSEGHETEEMHWEGDVLVLTSGEHAVVEHLVRRYHRNASHC